MFSWYRVSVSISPPAKVIIVCISSSKEADEQADDHPVRGKRERPAEHALEPGDVRLHVHDHAVLRLPRRAQRAGLGLVERHAADGALGQVEAADAVLDQVAGDRGGRVPVPGHRAVRELGVRGAPPGSLQDAVGQNGLALGDGVVEVVGGLGGRVVVERHPVLGADRLGGHEAAVTLGLVGPEPSLGGAVPVVVHAGPPGVGHGHPERSAVADRRGRGDDQLVGRARGAVPGVLRGRVGGGQLGSAGRRERVVRRPADRVELGGLVRARVRVVLPVRVAGVGRLDERERRGPAVHPDRGDGHVRTVRLVHRPALEVQAEAGQALGGPVGQRDVVAGQEAVAGGVVDQAYRGVHAGVAAVAGLRVQPGAGRGQGVGASGAAAAGPGRREGGGGVGGRDGPQDQGQARRSGDRATVTDHLRYSLHIRRTNSIPLNRRCTKGRVPCRAGISAPVPGTRPQNRVWVPGLRTDAACG